jgi:hypothetical protein
LELKEKHRQLLLIDDHEGAGHFDSVESAEAARANALAGEPWSLDDNEATGRWLLEQAGHARDGARARAVARQVALNVPHPPRGLDRPRSSGVRHARPRQRTTRGHTAATSSRGSPARRSADSDDPEPLAALSARQERALFARRDIALRLLRDGKLSGWQALAVVCWPSPEALEASLEVVA